MKWYIIDLVLRLVLLRLYRLDWFLVVIAIEAYLAVVGIQGIPTDSILIWPDIRIVIHHGVTFAWLLVKSRIVAGEALSTKTLPWTCLADESVIDGDTPAYLAVGVELRLSYVLVLLV